MAESDSDWEDEESGEASAPCPCLFCDKELESSGGVLDHCSGEHGVDIQQIRAKLGR